MLKPQIVQQKLTRVLASSLVFDPDNPNVMTASEEEALVISMHRFGYDEFIQVQRHEIDEKGKIITKFKNMVANGEHRAKKLIADGHKYILCVYRDMTEAERLLMRQTHNKLGGTHDAVKDKKELERLREMGMIGDLSDLIAISTNDLEFQMREGTRFATTESDPNPLAGSAQTYLEGNIKQIVLFFDNKSYQEIMPKVEQIMKHFKFDNHTDTFLKIFDDWWKLNEKKLK